ncbi:MAG: hypothetical protein KDA29_00955 [Phycisphaerales bacterium]|nr:hypothetical protein [Phycisphaerales bacterium]
MKLMNKRNHDSNFNRMLTLIAASGLAVGGSAALAQDSDYGSQPDDHMEYEPGEGLHEEEWYDPTDWWDDDFDGVRGPDVDYEGDRYDSDWTYDWHNGFDGDEDAEGYYAVYGGDSYDWSWWDESDTELYNDGYYSGYYDGYSDDKFGYDHMSVSDDRSDTYRNAYESGYYDGYYDQRRGYDSDWTYYIYTTPVDDRRADSSRERKRDDSRERGDRATEAGTDSMSRRQASDDAKHRDQSRTRGTVEKVERLKKAKLGSGMKDHRVLRLTFENGEQVVADLGSNSKSGLIEKGDRVTLSGKRISKDGRKMVDVSRLSVNDEVMWNSKYEDQPQQVSSR